MADASCFVDPGSAQGVSLRERLVQLASSCEQLANGRRVRLVAHALLFAGVVFLIVRLRSILRGSDVHLTEAGWWWLAAATLLGVVAVVCSSLIWLVILRRLGALAHSRSVAIYLQGQLGKYVPGAVWQYASRAAMARVHGLPVRVVARSLPIELAATASAGAAFTFLALGWWGAVGVAAAIGAAAGLGALLSGRRVGLRIAAQTIPFYAATWPLIGLSFWMTARAFIHVTPSELALYTGAFAAAWIVGLLAIYAPGGIGVREAVLVAILGPRIGSAEALVIAAASRAVFTLADLTPAVLSLPLLRRRRRGGGEEDSLEDIDRRIPAEPLDGELARAHRESLP
jgi:glycosyltransferase 2 family protein